MIRAHTSIGKFSLTALALIVAMVGTSAHAAVTQATSDGDWNDTGTWSPSVLPGATDEAQIANGATVSVKNLVTADIGLFKIGLEGVGATSSGTLVIDGGTLVESGTTGHMEIAVGGTAAVYGELIIRNDGTLDGNNQLRIGMGGGSALATGVMRMSGENSYADGGNIYLGYDANSQGILHISGGLITTTGELDLGNNASSSGTIYISGGEVSAVNQMYVGDLGDGLVHQTGGTMTQSGNNDDFIVGRTTGSTGTYILEEGLLRTGDRTSIGGSNLAGGGAGSGWFLQSGGYVHVGYNRDKTLAIADAAGAYGYYHLTGGSLLFTGNSEMGRGNGAYGELHVDGGKVNTTGNDDLRVGSNGSGVGVLNIDSGLVDLDDDLLLGYAGTATGIVDVSGGQLDVAKNLFVGHAATATGTMRVSGGVVNASHSGGEQFRIGNNGGGVLVLTGGVINSGENLVVAYAAGSQGSVSVEGGVLNIAGDGLRVGRAGVGVFDHSNGTVNIDADGGQGLEFLVGNEPGGDGVYNLSGTGVLDVTGNMIVGYVPTGVGLFNYAGGELTVSGPVEIGRNGTGSMDHTAGVLAVDSLGLGTGATGRGTYTLSGTGALNVNVLTVGDAGTAASVFAQTAGSAQAGALVIGAVGGYDYQGGYLNFNNLTVDADSTTKLDMNGGSSTINASGGIVDYSVDEALATNAGSATFNVDGLVLTKSGGTYTAGSEWGDFNLTGQSHAVGSGPLTLTIDLPNAVGTLTDHVNATGRTVKAMEGGFLNLEGGLTQSGGEFNLGTGALIVNDSSGISGGGLLEAASIFIGSGGDGTWSNTGGTVITSGTTLVLGQFTGDTGTLNLSAGGLEDHDSVIVGAAGTGVVTQTGGNLIAGNITLGQTAGDGSGNGGVGSWALSGGTVTVDTGQFIVGLNGVANDPASVFTQTGGTVYQTASNMVVGAEGVGSYIITGGLFEQAASQIVLGRGSAVDAGRGVMTIDGGTVKAPGIVLGNQTLGEGTLNLTSGLLETSGAANVIGGNQNTVPDGKGWVYQTGGTWDSSGGHIYLGYQGTDAYGEYNLSGATSLLTQAAGQHIYVGVEGTGVFNQVGAKLEVGNDLRIGNGATGVGEYNLSGDGVITMSSYLYVGVSGTGVFNHTSGTVTVGNATSDKLRIGNGAGSLGSYIMDGGLLDVKGELQVGQQGNDTDKAVGVFIQNGGTVLTNHFEMASERDSDGTYIIKAGLLRATSTGIHEIGDSNDGTALFQQDGGEVEFAGKVAIAENNGLGGPCEVEINAGSLTIGTDLEIANGGGIGTFDLNGGDVIVGNDILIGAGNNAQGVFLQSGGTVRVGGALLGPNSTTSSSTYSLSDGLLEVADESFVSQANSAVGAFFQMDGTANFASKLWITDGGYGRYELSGSTSLATAKELQFSSNADRHGTVDVSGGKFLVEKDALWIDAGGDALTTAVLDLTGGTFQAGREMVQSLSGNGISQINQNGGTNITGALLIGAGGTYDYVSGVMEKASIQIRDGGTLDLNGATITFNVNGLYEFSSGTLLGAENATLNVNGLVLTDGFSNPATGWGSYSASGPIHTVGTDFTLDSGTITGGGFMPDHVIATGGTFDATGTALDLQDGLEMSAGKIDLGYGRLIVNDEISGISGGELIVGSMHIAWDDFAAVGNPVGKFTQTGGVVTVAGTDTLIVGQDAGDIGTYVLSAGVLNTTGGAIVGQSGNGSFLQSGGTHNADTVTVALNANAVGLYEVTGGTTDISGTLTIGQTAGTGRGSFVVDGGRAVIGDVAQGAETESYLIYSSGELVITDSVWETQRFILGDAPGTNVSYTVGSGDLITIGQGLNVGKYGSATLTQTDGEIAGAGILYLGGEAGGVGTMDLSGGEVSISGVYVGGWGTGVLNHTNGLISSNTLYIGNSTDSVGTYNVSSNATADIAGQLRIGNAGTGVMNQSGGDLLVNQFMVGYAATGVGEYNMSGGTLTTDAGGSEVGSPNGVGVVNHSGGTIYLGQATEAANYNTRDFAIGGSQAAGTGTYNMTGSDALLSVSKLFRVGFSGDGVMNQSDGTVEALGLSQGGGGTVKQHSMSIGQNAGSTGIYNLTGGTLISSGTATRIGENGTGTLNISGAGEATLSETVLGQGATGVGLIDLDAGKLTVTGDITTNNGQGRLNYDGGTLTVGGGMIGGTRFTVALGNEAGDDTTLNVNGSDLSELSPSILYIGIDGAGTVNQSAGLVLAGYVDVGADGRYNYTGGVFGATGGLAGSGVADFGSQALTLNADSLLVDIEDLTLQNHGGVEASLGSDSLVIVKLLSDLSGFGSFTGSAKTHVAGSGDITFSGTEGFTGWGTVDDKVSLSGTGTIQKSAAVDSWLILKGGLDISGGTVNVTEIGGLSQSGGTVTTDTLIIDHLQGSTPGDISGGQLNVGSLKVATIGTGLFTQTGGEVNITSATTLVIGESASTFGSTGTYLLEGGDINSSVSDISIGLAGTGVLLQSGGNITLTGDHDIFVGDGATGDGEYRLSEDDGTANVSAQYLYVGRNGQGLYVQTAGTASLTQLRVGHNGTAMGTALISGDLLTTSTDMTVGWSGTGHMEYTGGEVNVGGSLFVGRGGSGVGELIVTGTTLDVGANIRVGWVGASSGSMTQTAATVNATSVILGEEDGTTGVYTLNSGLLDLRNGAVSSYIGNGGTGTFIQNGGTVQIYRDTWVGQQTTSLGSYIMDGADSLLDIRDDGGDNGVQLGIGEDNGKGVFIQKNGTVRVTDVVGGGTTNIVVGMEGEGTYILKNGLLDMENAQTLVVGRNSGHGSDAQGGWFIQSGGTAIFTTFDIVNNFSGKGTIEMSGGYLKTTAAVNGANEGDESYIGEDKNTLTAIIQSGGTIDITAQLVMARLADDSPGLSDTLLDISGADSVLTIGDFLTVGRNGTATVNQADGNVTVGTTLTVGQNATAVGEYNLGGGSLSVDTITLANTAGASGVFNWSAGALSAGTLNVNPGGLFDGSTGSGDLMLVDLHVGTSGSVVDLGSNALTVTGTGTLAAGGGTIRAGDFTVGGSFTQLGGEVRLAASSVTVGPGATYALGDLNSTGAILQEATGANLTVNSGGRFIGWTDKAGNGGINLTGTLTNDGQVIADGFGKPAGTVSIPDRTLDLTSFTSVASTVANPGATGDAGWYAQNQGTLALPPVAISGAGTYNWGEPQSVTTPDLVNSLQLDFTSFTTGFDAEIKLLSNDDPDVIADLDVAWEALGVKFIGVWLFEDDSAAEDDFDALSWSATFRYDYLLLQDLLTNDPNLNGGKYDENDLRVYYYDEVLGDWVMLNVDITQELDTTNKLIWIPDGAGMGEGMYAIVIPEPGTMALLALGGVGMLVRRRRRKVA